MDNKEYKYVAFEPTRRDGNTTIWLVKRLDEARSYSTRYNFLGRIMYNTDKTRFTYWPVKGAFIPIDMVTEIAHFMQQLEKHKGWCKWKKNK